MTTALTSLAPNHASSPVVGACLASWRRAGLDVVAFNHPSEIRTLRRQYDGVEFVPVKETMEAQFGRRVVPVSMILRWALDRDLTCLLINSDIELDLERWELERVAARAGDGLAYFVRHNHDGIRSRARREDWGIDAFLLRGSNVGELPDSFLSMGQAWWDYWLPWRFLSAGRPLYAPAFPAAFHRRHALQWSWDAWYRCGIEFQRLTGEGGGITDHEACRALSIRIRQAIDRATTPIPRRPGDIREWVESRFRTAEPKLFLELGAHRGEDTEWLSRIPHVTLHAFEPDPRNVPPPLPNVTVHRAAVGDHDGVGRLILSAEGWGQREWTYSSSLRQPKNHLERYPVTFNGSVDVEVISLDSFFRQHGLGVIDFIWADVQGAEGDLIRGGVEALRNTRYLYTEYSDDELYDGQIGLTDILALLPEFRILELWPEDVLLENRRLAS